MSIDKTQLEKIASLAKLALDPEKSSQQTDEFNEILSFVERMNSIDTHQVVPMTHLIVELLPNVEDTRFRADKSSHLVKPENYQAGNAPATHEDLYIVPAVIEEK